MIAQHGNLDERLQSTRFSNDISSHPLKVNEDGTEAAAATAIGITMKSAPMRPRTFNADHPFLYIIASHVGEIFFAGRHT